MRKDILADLRAIPSSRKDLRSFGYTVGGFLFILSAFLYWRHGSVSPFWPGVGFVLVLAGYLRPEILKPAQKLWMAIAVVMGFFMSRIILALVFFLVLTPIGLLTRLGGKVHLDTSFRGLKVSTYWRNRSQHSARETYERQF